MLSSRRKSFSSFSEKMGEGMSFMGPNAWTFLSVILGIAAAYFVAGNSFLTGAFFFLLAALCDAIDGAVARYKKSVSKHGAYLDTIIDRYVEFFIIVGIFFAALPSFWINAKLWLFIYMFGAMMTTYSKAAAKEKGLTKEELRYGLLERAERMALLFLGILMAAASPIYLVYMIALLAVLANVTALQRTAKALGA